MAWHLGIANVPKDNIEDALDDAFTGADEEIEQFQIVKDFVLNTVGEGKLGDGPFDISCGGMDNDENTLHLSVTGR